MANPARVAPLLLLMVAVVASWGCAASEGPVERIVLITIDTLRHDAVAVDAQGASPLPQVAAYFASGTRFSRAYSATGATQPTHASIFTGRHPWDHGVTRNGLILPDSETTLAETLAEVGFETAAVVSSFPLENRFGFGQGFSRYEKEFGVDPGWWYWEGNIVASGFYGMAGEVTDRAIELLDAARGPRQFFWFHYFDPHDPYGDTTSAGTTPITLEDLLRAAEERLPQFPSFLEQAQELYQVDTRFLDSQLARLFEQLDRAGDGVTTHVLLTGDHGESFGESGSMGHGHRLTPSVLRVPLLVRSPAFAAEERPDVTGSVDLYATILALAGIGTDGSRGRDLRQPGEGRAFGMRRSYAAPHHEIRTDGSFDPKRGHRFYAVLASGLWTGDSRRISLNDEPAWEISDPRARQQLTALFHHFEESLLDSGVTEAVDAETQEALRALGYVR
jgi:arylsulfatase A-like enzyme